VTPPDAWVHLWGWDLGDTWGSINQPIEVVDEVVKFGRVVCSRIIDSYRVEVLGHGEVPTSASQSLGLAPWLAVPAAWLLDHDVAIVSIHVDADRDPERALTHLSDAEIVGQARFARRRSRISEDEQVEALGHALFDIQPTGGC
jgi:hypothetical protein